MPIFVQQNLYDCLTPQREVPKTRKQPRGVYYRQLCCTSLENSHYCYRVGSLESFEVSILAFFLNPDVSEQGFRKPINSYCFLYLGINRQHEGLRKVCWKISTSNGKGLGVYSNFSLTRSLSEREVHS